MFTLVILAIALIVVGLQQVQQVRAEELMLEIEDDPYTPRNESGFRPAVVIEEVLRQMPNWNWNSTK